MQAQRFDDRSALVTGAASGIGRETSVLLAARGARLFLCDVNAEGLEETVRISKGQDIAAGCGQLKVDERAPARA